MFPMSLIFMFAPFIAFAIFFFLGSDSSFGHFAFVFIGVPVLFFVSIGIMMFAMTQRKNRIDAAIRNFNQLKATPIGIAVEWNDDYYKMYQSQYVRRRNVVIIQLLSPELVVKMNIPTRQVYCSRFGIPFEYPNHVQPSQQPPNSFYPPPDQPPPYSNPAYGPHDTQDYQQQGAWNPTYQPQFQSQPQARPNPNYQPQYQTKY